MNVRYFKRGPDATHAWTGQCEVDTNETTGKMIHYHHRDWPVRSDIIRDISLYDLHDLLRSNAWLEVFTDPALQVQEGL